MLTLKHDTYDATIEAATKAELAAALYSTSSAAAKHAADRKKSDLVAEAKARVAELKAAHEAAEKEAAEAHAKALADEAANRPEAAAIRRDLAAALEYRWTKLEKTLEDYKTKVTSDPHYAFLWNATGMLEAYNELRELADLRAFAKTEAEAPTKTIEEFAELLANDAERRTKGLLDSDYYSPNSTCPARNMDRTAECTAKRRVARITRWAAGAVRKDAAEYKSCCESISTYLG